MGKECSVPEVSHTFCGLIGIEDYEAITLRSGTDRPAPCSGSS